MQKELSFEKQRHKHQTHSIGVKISFLLTVLALMSVAAFSEAAVQPLKIIAPDLVVESCELGKFPDHHAPSDKQNKVIFIPTIVSKCCGYSFGYRIKLRTTRKQVKIAEQFEGFPSTPAGRMETPKNGLIYRDWDDGGVRKGPYWVRIWVEDVELPVLHCVRK